MLIALSLDSCYQALVEASEREIFEKLTCCYDEKYEKTKGAVGSQLVGERAKIILDEVRELSLFTQAECLRHIGSYHGLTVCLILCYLIHYLTLLLFLAQGNIFNLSWMGWKEKLTLMQVKCNCSCSLFSISSQKLENEKTGTVFENIL